MKAGRGLRGMAAAVAGALALAGVAACTGDDNGWDDDQVAAYVGERAITEAEVDEVAEDLRAALGSEIERELERLGEDGTLDEQALADHEERRFGELDQQVSVTRTRVLEMKILTEAATRYASQRDLQAPAPALEHHAHELGLAEDHSYVAVVAEFFAVMAVVQRESQPAEPTEADQRELYDNLVEAGLTSASFEEAQEVLTQELMGQQVGVRNLMREIVDDAPVRVNPRYDLVYRVPVQVGSGESYLGLPLGGADQDLD